MAHYLNPRTQIWYREARLELRGWSSECETLKSSRSSFFNYEMILLLKQMLTWVKVVVEVTVVEAYFTLVSRRILALATLFDGSGEIIEKLKG